MAIWNAFRRRPRRSPRGSKFSALGSSPRRIEPLEAKWLLASDNFVEFNLVSNQPATALITDPSLVGAWGIASSPGANGAFSVSDSISQRSSSFSGDVAGSPFAAGSGQPVFVPMPTGQVYNGAANEFLISPPTAAGPGASATGTSGSGTTTPQPAELLYASLDGTIYGFNSQIDAHHAVPAVSVANASFTGLTIANNGTADQLYAADSRGGNIDVFDTQFKPVTTSGSFTDPNLPAGDKPFNIQSLGGKLYVTYVSLPVLDPPGPFTGDGAIADGGFQAEMAAGALPFVAASGGVVDAFDANGNFVARIASGAPLDVPWGMAVAPSSFAQFAGDLLVANHGDGKINAFDPSTGALVGTLSGADGSAFVEPGLLGLAVGNGANAGDSGALYFTAGRAFNFPGSPEVTPPALHAQGAALPPPMGPLPILPAAADVVTPTFLQSVFGTVQVAGSDPLVAVGTNAQATIGQTYTGALAAFGSAETPSPTATGTPAATYTATINWGDGSSTIAGSVVATGHGGFVVLGAHVYSAAGSENYQVTIQDTSGNSATASGTIQVASAPLLAMGVGVESPTLAVTGATVADFVDTGATDPLANYSATINWGDGTSATAGTIVSASASGTSAGNPSLSGAFAVTGSHTYTTSGDYTLTIIISDTDGSQATVESHAHIASATLLATGVPVTSQFLSINGATVADFIDTGGADPLANYSSTIDWGDGTSASAGTIASSGDHFAVFGSHTYSAAGDYTLAVAITDSDGTSATAGSTANVASATLSAKGLPVESQTLAVDGAVAAVFHDTGGPDPLANYSATIDWGDGSSASAGTVVGFHEFFAVVGSHTYTASGNYNLSISI
ncbi:MAG TPA: TIGR03118 family protein, partial [Pirellulales bacterium]|nr:TIGR03118 family protein [Pirellulales bacterium]